MSAPLIDDEDDQYASSEDSDFAPDAGPAQDSDASDSEGAAADESDRPSKRRRTAGDAGIADDVGYDNSGDEAIVKKGEKKKRKKDKNRARQDAQDDDEGGEGGLIKTRRQRAAEKEERKVVATTGPVTIDVDALWAQMLAGNPPASASKSQPDGTGAGGNASDAPADGEPTTQPQQTTADTSELVRIKRTYNFAGKVHTEEKLVARDSAEAKLFFASQGEEAAAAAAADESLPSKRVAKKAFRSAFEPLTDPLPQRADLNLGVAARMQAGREAQAKKLNTVEKSRMDWAGFVDKEGIKDELELAGRAKGSYAAREDFLARSEARRDDDARRARVAARA